MKHLVKYLAMAAIVASMTACGGDDEDEPENTGGTETSKAEWHLEWYDEFTTPEVDPTVWRRCDRGKSDWNNNISKEDVCFGWNSTDGAVILRGLEKPEDVTDDQQYIVGGIETSGLKAFVPPFKLEIRARLGAAQGAWPAIWLMPYKTTNGWPNDGEIDIMERLNYDNMVYQTVHTDYTYNKGNTSNPVNSKTAIINGDSWNTFTITVTKSAIVWEVNGKETHRYAKLTPDVDGQYPFNQAQYLRMDMQLGGSWVGAVSGKDLPVEMEIDYVKYFRYYKK